MSQNTSTRKFVLTCDGGDGSGKTEMSARLRGQFEALFPGYRVKAFREPGGSLLGEACRAELATGKEMSIPALAEFTLFFAGRIALWRDIVRLLKQSGNENLVIFLDRSFASTWAYQVIARDGSTLIRQMFFSMVQELMEFMNQQLPDLEVHHLLIDITSEEAELRRQARPAAPGEILQFDDRELQELVWEGYRGFPSQVASGDLNPKGMIHTTHVVSGMGDRDTVFDRLAKAVSSILIPAAF